MSATSGFSLAFYSVGADWAAQISAAGEVLTLPLVVLISLLAQPRLFAAMSADGLVPAIFAHIENGNLRKGILISGFVMTSIASFTPFAYLNDMISAGVLVSFSLTSSSLVLIRKEGGSGLKVLLLQFNAACFFACVALSHFGGNILGDLVCSVGAASALWSFIKIKRVYENCRDIDVCGDGGGEYAKLETSS